MVGDQLLSEQEDRLEESRVIHKTIDPTVPAAKTLSEEAGDPARVIIHARPATAADGLLTSHELAHLFSGPILKSAYDEALGQHRINCEVDGSQADVENSPVIATLGDRELVPPNRRGSHEPEYTSYTHYWKSVLGQFFHLYKHVL
jgi:RNA exonuclease NGL2